ncbi:hypothetical protein T4C_9938, partial [Trichinella pseudospiralis]
LHNGALEISFRGLELSEGLLLIGHFIFVIFFTIDFFSNNNLKNKNRIKHGFKSSAKVSMLTTLYLWNKWPLKLPQCLS